MKGANRFALFTVILLLSACSGGGGGGAATTPPVTGGGGGNQYGSGPDPVPAPTGNPTSYELIDAAKTAGSITAEDALIYKMFVEFGDPRLPAQFKGDDTGFIEGDAQHQVLDHIASVGINNVSTATLDTLRPFFVPAYYEGSWWHQQNPGATLAPATQTAILGATGIGTGMAKPLATSGSVAANPNCRPFVETECSPLAEWKNVKGTHVVIWYLSANETTDWPKAVVLASEFDNTIWPKLTTLMDRRPISDVGTGLIAETDPRLDVLLVDLPASKEGATYPSTISGCKAVPAHIYLSRNLPDHGLIAQAAHEFMHAIQLSIDVKARCLENYYTIQEATAVWATNFVYPENDWEHTYAKSYLRGLWLNLSYDYRPPKPSVFRYGAYVFPIFLETRFGPTIVKRIWDKTTTFSQELYAIDGAIIDAGALINVPTSFEKEWPKFAAANWNRDALNTYFKFDIIADQVDLNGDETLSIGPGGWVTQRHAVSLPHASASYYRVVFGDNAIRSVTITNGLTYKAEYKDTGNGNVLMYTGLDATARKGASMQAYLKVNGVWQSGTSNLTNAPWSMFCRDDPAGKVDEIIFIYANSEISPSGYNYSDLSPSANGPGLYATNIGCRDWTGSLSMSSPLAGGAETLTVSGVTLKNLAPTAAPAPSIGDTLPPYPLAAGQELPQGFGWVYAIAAGNATWSYTDNSNGCTRNGSRSFTIGNASRALITNSGFTPPGAADHGIFIPGFLGNAHQTVTDLSYDWRCVNTDGSVTSGTRIVGTNLDIAVTINNPAVRISTGTGLSVSGTGAQSGDAPYASGSWSLQGATN